MLRLGYQTGLRHCRGRCKGSVQRHERRVVVLPADPTRRERFRAWLFGLSHLWECVACRPRLPTPPDLVKLPKGPITTIERLPLEELRS